MPECAEEGCDEPGVVELHIPWADNRVVCTAHARVLGRRDGVVASPREDAEWPETQRD